MHRSTRAAQDAIKRLWQDSDTNASENMKHNAHTITAPVSMAEFSPMPGSRQRCPVTGLSRSHAYSLSAEGEIRVIHTRRKGKLIGRAFIDVASVRAYFSRMAKASDKAKRNRKPEAATDTAANGEETTATPDA